ncbi:uncharacterized protein LOC103028505 isoform X1 [Astyanax mexicanus]|uniref:uncharacterized protein LOC103028505 isoform X1 n=1 Tax=Astyanax mexicanus TaxID=7994 RepID=UPI0020CB61A4|nr:uncharacterized protein LOC103028505 isoform X1 [Astyanax mexicanus]
MTESIVRKIQPFTIGTKLSAPAGPRSPLLPTDCAPALTLNNRAHPRSLGQQVSVCSRPGQSTDQYRRPADHPHHEHRAREDHLNRNQLSPNTTSRSARKITISNRLELSRTRAFLQTHNSEKNINNNNNNNNNTSSSCTAPTLLPRIERVHCEKQPKPKTAESKSRLPKEDIMRNSPPCSHPEVSVVSKVLAVQNDCCYTQQNAIFSQELSQAEAWIHRKLKFLRDSSNMQRRSLAEWEEISQTLQRDLKDFENTFIQLHQMGEKLICKRNPESDLVKKNLIQLKDLWSSLKQTADSQIKAAGEAQNVQEFNKKVDQLETWIKQKEEKQSLAGLLGENIDKLQLTRRILDLKQDEQLYRSLLEDINNLALKLEKQGKSESKNISTRRKHINKMWLKVQSNLKDCLENLHLALEVSSFYQQADNIIFSINNMRKGLSVNKRAKVSGDGEIRGIASQIMMLDVTVSQLSKLHLALSTRVSQKQAEVKDSWLLLQNTVRNEKAVHLHLTTREDCDLPTLNQEPRKTVGTDSHRIMGKGMKEEQNHLKGITEKNTRLSPNSQKEPQPDPGESLGCMCPRDSMANFQTKSGTPSKPSSFPQFYTQLQKFTVSADKTLSWLKDSVTMATNVCSSMEEPGSYEVAKKYQASLEKDILSNKDRIELVKKEGHSLVRAQHPGSTKIQEFLSQLEVLWEELNRRHQKNGVVLCAAEELNRKVVRVLQRLGSLEAWLEAVELSIKQVSLAGDPESVSVAERESSLLEKELETHGQELPSLRQEIEALCCQSHCHAQLLYTRMEDIDKKFSRVQMALTQQSSELKDTRMLTEFLERVELEENHYNTLGQPLKSDLDCEPTLLPRAGSADSELVECLVDPVEELREAVEMLNDTARERGRCQEHDHCIRELLKRHSTIAIRVEECLQHCAELAIDILEMENKMAVRCEPERCGLASLQEQQDQLKVHYNALEEEVKVMESLSAQLAVLCPERLHALKIEVETSLQAWEELGRSMAENQRRLLQFSHLRHFFRSYLEMISWTEDTRSRIFSESALCEDRESHGSIVEHLDQQIELKFKDFDLLAAAGAKLLSEDHHLAKMIKERMEELRSMLGWILVHWRVQRDQWLNRKRSEEPHTDDIYSEALVPLLESETLSEQPKRTEDSTTVIPGGLKDRKQLDDGYEVMESICPKDSESQPASEQVHSPNLELKEQNTPSLGGTVNLILSFSNSGDNQLQLQEPDHEKVEELPEDVHRPPKPHNSVCKSFWKRCQGLLGSLKRKKKFYQHSAEEVSTYLHVKDAIRAATPVYENMTLHQLHDMMHNSTSFSPCASLCSSSSPEVDSTSSVDLLVNNNTSSIFSSLRRKSKKRKKKKDVHGHTVQRILRVEPLEEVSSPPAYEPVMYSMHTWPLKEKKKRKSERKSENKETQLKDYVKNHLVKDTAAECLKGLDSPHSNVVMEQSAAATTGHVKNHCRFLSLGSVLSFDLPKDMSHIPSIQDIITIVPAEPRKTALQEKDSHLEQCKALSTFKLAQSQPTHHNEGAKHTKVTPVKTTLEIDCQDNEEIRIDATSISSTEFPPAPPPVEHISFKESQNSFLRNLTSIQLKRISRISSLHEETGLECAHQPVHPPNGIKESRDQNEKERISAPHNDLTAENHICPSVHTLIQDLHGHHYHKAKPTCSQPQRQSPPAAQSHASHVVFKANGREDSVDSGHSSSGSFKLCTEIPYLDTSEYPGPRKALGKLYSLEVEESQTNMECLNKEPNNSPVDGPVHPDHQQFEQEEKELEDIWNQTNSYRQSICSDIMYHSNRSQTSSSSPGQQREHSPKEQAVLIRKMITTSAPNLLTAEFRLPCCIQALTDHRTDSSLNTEAHILCNKKRRSWGVFPQQDQFPKESMLINETASQPVKLPEHKDPQKYIYQYREEEEEKEEEEEEKEGDDKGGIKDTSMSLLSVHMDLMGAATEISNPNTREQTTTSPESGRQEFPSMEGTLERKHKLLLGGRRAPSRAWSSCHAVLYRRTLSFYQDRKDTIRSSVTSLPLSLVGAECMPAPEYTKKPNCFSLRLRDGSEYLLSASSLFLMKTWILRIQANADSLGDLMEHKLQSQSPSAVPSSSSSKQDCTTSKRRSYSFTSATYQQIKPCALPPSGTIQNDNTTYSVTVFIGDGEKLAACSSAALPQPSACRPQFSQLPLRGYASLPPPQHKHTLRKFFGKE